MGVEEQQARVERVFHDVIWAAANDSMRVERAVVEARDVMYLLLQETAGEMTVRHEAVRWLDTFGRDPLKERKLAGERS